VIRSMRLQVSVMPTPRIAGRHSTIVIGRPHNSGILVADPLRGYQTCSKQPITRQSRAHPTTSRAGTNPLKAEALQFSLAHPATAASSRAPEAERIAEDYAALNTRSRRPLNETR